MAAFFGLISLVVVFASQLVSLAALSQRLHGEIDREIAGDVHEYTRATSRAASVPALVESSYAFIQGHSDANGRPAAIFRIEFLGGTVLLNTFDTRVASLLEKVRPGAGHLLTVGSSAIGDLRVAAVRVQLDGQTVAALKVAVSLSPVEATLRGVAAPMLLLSLAGVLLGALAAYLIVTAGLAPIRRITETAAAISEEDMSRRIGYRGPDDEVGRLAATFDGMIARLEAAFRQQRRFFTLASHELRTPLTIAQGHLQVLRRSKRFNRADVEQALDVSLEELERGAGMVNDLLLLGRVVQGQVGPVEAVDPAALIREVHRKVSPTAARDWHLALRPTGPVHANRQQLSVVLLNLVNNAVRHTGEGGRIELGCWREGAWAVITVQDSGRGIAPEDLPHVFDPWYRGTSSNEAGAGLGLAIVREVVHGLGGRIEVRSRTTAGTTFTLRLPLGGDPPGRR
jgi:signal transduction histidine kinase